MAAPKAHIKVSGSYKEIQKMHVRVSGSWKRVNKAYVKVSGAWKQFLQSAAVSSFSGLFTTTGGTATVTSATRTYTLGAGNSGNLQFSSVSIGGTTFTYSLNGAAFVGITEGLTITLANTNTLALKAAGLASGYQSSCDLVDVDTGLTLESVALARS